MANGKSEINLPDLSAQTLAAATMVVALVALGFWLLFRFHQVILILIAGIVVSLALSPIVERLKARGISPGVAVGSLYGLMLVAVLLFLRFGAPLIADQAATIGSQMSGGYAAVRQGLLDAPNLLMQQLAESLLEQPGAPAAPPAEPPAEAGDVVSSFEGVARYSGLGIKALYQAGAIFLIAFFWTIEAERIKRAAVGLLPLNQRESARDFIAEIEQRVGGYVTGQLLLCLIIGSLSLAAYLIIGLPYAPALAFFVAIMELIPLIGPLVGAIPALVIGFSISPLTALWTILASIIIHQLEANVFGPRVMKRTLGMRPLVTLLALTAFGSLFGVLGALVALPLASVLQLIFDRFLVDPLTQIEAGDGRDRLGLLRYETQKLVEDVRKVMRRREGKTLVTGEEDEMVEDALEAIALDLDSLLANSRDVEVEL